MRAFIGTLLSAANQDASTAFGERLVQASHGALRPIPPRSAHITHVFLGDVDDALVAAVGADLDDLLMSMAPISFRLREPEVLLAGREPRLVLAGLERGHAEVAALTKRIAHCLRGHPVLAGIAPARSPHVTLARFRRGAGPGDGADVTRILRSGRTSERWHDDCLQRVELVRSDLTPRGPIYSVVAAVPARGPA